MERRTDIEGLRGIAIIGVVLFHSGYNFACGGYIGVDIFFVLSGYLISGSIQQSILQNKFSLIEFYRRRMFRILPAALFVILIVGLIGQKILFPEELKELSESVFAFTLIASNIWAADSINYFGIGIEYKPLIHYWSLSMELQFYLMFPLLISFFLKRSQHNLLIFLCLIIFVSSLFYANFYIEQDPNRYYFSTIMRAWEFTLGVILCLLNLRRRAYLVNNNFKNIILAISIAIIIVCFFLFDERSYVPGNMALLPCIGAAAILVFSDQKIFFTKFISNHFLRFMGLISFSLYLVHQPILAYYRIVNGRDLSGYERPYLILISVLVSCILYVLIEKPFQKNIKFQGRVPLQMVFAVVIFSFIYSYEGMTENLPQFRLNSEVLKYLKFRYDNNPRLNNCRVDNKIINPEKACLYGPSGYPEIALWGDSHADQIVMPLANESTKRGFSIVEFAISGCPPMIDIKSKTAGRKCLENSRLILDYLKHSKKIKHVLLFSYWIGYFDENQIYSIHRNGKNEDKEEYIKSLGTVVSELIKSGKKVHLIYPTPKMKVNPPLYAARMKLIDSNSDIPDITLSKEEYESESYKSTSVLNNVVKKYEVRAIHISDYLYDKKLSAYNALDKNISLYRDDNHLSYTGGVKIAGKIINEVLR